MIINDSIEIIKKEKLSNKFKIILNLIIYYFKKIISKDKSTEKLLLKKVFINCYVNSNYIEYNYELLTFLLNFETKEYLNEIINNKSKYFIDIWSNIWRLSWIYNKFNLYWENIIMCDPNPFVFNLSKDFYNNKLNRYKKINLLNNAISNDNKEISFFILKDNELNWIWSIYEENLWLANKEEIKVLSISFEELIKKNNINESELFIKIDVEWHEKIVLESIMDYIKKSNLLKVIVLVEIWEKNVNDIKTYVENDIITKSFDKISFNDYIIIFEK